jgi:hypothetical protein
MGIFYERDNQINENGVRLNASTALVHHLGDKVGVVGRAGGAALAAVPA